MQQWRVLYQYADTIPWDDPQALRATLTFFRKQVPKNTPQICIVRLLIKAERSYILEVVHELLGETLA